MSKIHAHHFSSEKRGNFGVFMEPGTVKKKAVEDAEQPESAPDESGDQNA